jgi:hypothetical protein
MYQSSPRREIGPIGTVSRVIGGLVAIGLPIVLSGIGWWDVGAALIVFPAMATALATLVTAAYEHYSPGSLMKRHVVCSGPGCVLTITIVAIAFTLSALTPISDVAFWVWLGASMLLAAVRGYGGCEVLAFPNVITGRRDRIGCILYTPIDAAEARHRARRTYPSTGAPQSVGG